MKNKKKISPEVLPGNVSKSGASLRHKAEEQIIEKHSGKSSALTVQNENTRSEADTSKLLHELEVHQIELEMQNEELQLAVDKAVTATALYDFSPSGYFTLDRGGNICQLNFSGARMLGKNRSALVTRKFEQFITVDTRPGFTEFFKNIFETDSKQSCEVLLTMNGNPSIFVYLEGIVAPEEKKCLVTAIDITEAKEAEAVSKEKSRALHRMATIVSDSNDAVILHDLEGKILAWNRGAIETYGFTEAEALKMNIRDIGSETDREAALTLIERIRNGEIINSFELRRVTRDGRILDVWLTATLLSDEKGIPTAVATTGRDITERKRAESELIAAKEKAEESDRLKSAFLANMSHELRTPLNSIIGFSEMMTEPDYDTAQQYKFARMINVSGHNLLSIINDIMDISKIEAGQVQIQKARFSVNRLVGDLQKEYSFKAIEKGIELKVDWSNSIKEILIDSDENKLKQIFVNLIGNAIKFTKEGFIEIGFEIAGDFVQFHIKDSGIGIASEFHQQIFERFRQVETSLSRKYGGNGLGLPISKSLIELLGGSIRIESEKGKGSTFYFLIPIS